MINVFDFKIIKYVSGYQLLFNFFTECARILLFTVHVRNKMKNKSDI